MQNSSGQSPLFLYPYFYRIGPPLGSSDTVVRKRPYTKEMSNFIQYLVGLGDVLERGYEELNARQLLPPLVAVLLTVPGQQKTLVPDMDWRCITVGSFGFENISA